MCEKQCSNGEGPRGRNQLKTKQGAKLMAISWLTTPWADIELDSRTRRGCDMLGWA